MTRSLTTNGMCWWWPSSSVFLLSWGSSSYIPLFWQDVLALTGHYLNHVFCSASSGPTNLRVASWTTGRWGRLTFSWGSARRPEWNPSLRFGHFCDENFIWHEVSWRILSTPRSFWLTCPPTRSWGKPGWWSTSKWWSSPTWRETLRGSTWRKLTVYGWLPNSWVIE